VMDDLGSGALIDFARLGLDPEPTAQASIKAGADVVTFSADKLIGGPQGGILLGTQQAIARIRKNQWARILRIGKLELIALEATLKLFLDPDRLIEQNPTIRMLRMDTATLSELASRLAEQIRAAAPAFEVAVIDSTSELGSGSMPTRQLPTKAVAVTLPGTSPDELGRKLRLADPPIFTRIVDDRVLLDVRTIQDDEYALVTDAFRGLNP
jgi:L-seryl-tRNA(Ser) seleniumtransferase